MRDHKEVARLRKMGAAWSRIASIEGFPNGEAARNAHNRYLNRQKDSGDKDSPESVIHDKTYDPSGFKESEFPKQETNGIEETVTLSAKSFRNVRTLDDLIAFFDIDTDVWEIKSFNIGGSEWDQSVKDGTVAQSIKIHAHFVRKKSVEDDQARVALEQALKDLQTHDCLNYEPLERTDNLGGKMRLLGGEGFLFELAIHDPHIGMLAWAPEVGGVSQDLKTIILEYGEAVEALLQYALLYNTERILYILGHDMQHVNQTGLHGKGGTTAKGTTQDVDGRIAKIFSTIRKAAVAGIDRARLIAPVDVMVVPGNHDLDESYKLGEVISAWYRNDPEVNVLYSPDKRKYYGFGRNVFMMTHGEEYKRKRDSLPLIFATECPPELWIAGDVCREIHTGHFHVNMEGGYYPTAEADETRAIRTRCLPGFTATDAWHHEQGYHHRRTATALIYRKSGGIAGLHEFNL